MTATRVLGIGTALLALAGPVAARGQTVWRLPSTVGYGVLGAAAGLVSAGATGYELDALPLVALATAGGGVLGAVGGYRIGRSADRQLARGTPLSARHKNAVRLGVVLTGATAGAAVWAFLPRPIVLRNGSYIEAYSSDEALLRGAGVGALGGALVQWWLDGRLEPRARVSVGPRGAGAAAVTVTMRVR